MAESDNGVGTELAKTRVRIAFASIVLTAVTMLGGSVTALVGGGYFFATITGQMKNVGEDVGEIKDDVKTLSREIDKRIEQVDTKVQGLDIRVNRLEVQSEIRSTPEG